MRKQSTDKCTTSFNDLGTTPAKREFNYPKALAATSPHDRIIRRFWSAHNETDMEVSMSISEVSKIATIIALSSDLFRSNQGNETAFMNGVNDVQSSSMVQQRNVPTSSPIAQQSPMELEQIDTIMEDNNGEQASVVTSSTLMEPQLIPNRVLTALSTSISNTPSMINGNKPPIDNPLRDSSLSSDEVGESIFF